MINNRLPIHELMAMLTHSTDEDDIMEVGIELDMRLANGTLRYDLYNKCKEIVFKRLEEIDEQD